jgi:DNA-binding XRE family transcriptional regulator
MNKKYNNEIRKYRLLNNSMNQTEFGKKICLSRNVVCNIETGKRIPTLIEAHKIAKMLNTTIDELFFSKGNPGVAKVPDRSSARRCSEPVHK